MFYFCFVCIFLDICHMNGFLFIDHAILELFGHCPETYNFIRIYILPHILYVYL